MNTKALTMPKIRQTFQYVFYGILTATIAAGLFLPVAGGITGLAFFGLVLLFFGSMFLFVYKTNIFTYLSFTAISGIILTPALAAVVDAGNSIAIFQAFVATTVITLGFTVYAAATKKDYLSWGPLLFWSLVVLILLTIANIIIGSTILHTILSVVIVGLFSVYIIYDVQTVIKTEITPLEAAMNIYLDMINIFASLLNLFSQK